MISFDLDLVKNVLVDEVHDIQDFFKGMSSEITKENNRDIKVIKSVPRSDHGPSEKWMKQTIS